MKKVATVRRGEIIDKMFPHSMNLTRHKCIKQPTPFQDGVYIDELLASEWPCSVQKNVQEMKDVEGGAAIVSGYVILCPYIDADDLSGELTLTVEFDGKTRSVEGTDIELIQNNYIYDLAGWKIGCKITISGWMT